MFHRNSFAYFNLNTNLLERAENEHIRNFSIYDYKTLKVKEVENRYRERELDFDNYKSQQNSKPEVQLRADINMLMLEKVIQYDNLIVNFLFQFFKY